MRKKLADILNGKSSEDLARAWDETQAAEDFAPLPTGEYIARIVDGECFNAGRNGTPGYKLTFQILEGPHKGRRFWHDLWLTDKALVLSKRDLGKLGVTHSKQLEMPMPEGIRCRVKLTLRKDDDDTERNRVKTFDVIGIDPPEDDPFAPSPCAGDPPPDAGDAWEPPIVTPAVTPTGTTAALPALSAAAASAAPVPQWGAA